MIAEQRLRELKQSIKQKPEAERAAAFESREFRQHVVAAVDEAQVKSSWCLGHHTCAGHQRCYAHCRAHHPT
jgi:hypothetical protein